MKHPALNFLTLLIVCGLISAPSLRSQEPPTKDRSSKEAHEKKIIGDPPRALPKEFRASEKAKTAAVKQPAKKEPAPQPSGVMILVEFIEVAHEDFSDWVFENKLTADATELRKEIQKWVKKEDAEILKTVVIHARSGQRAQAQSIVEVIYPTEFDPPETPSQPNLSDNTSLPVIPATSTAFETRNVGTTVEVDPVISEDGQLIDLNLSPEMVFRLEDLVWITESNGEAQVVPQPLFYTAKATTQVTVRNGGYALIASLQGPPEEDDDDEEDDEIILLFVRADAS